MDRIGSPPIAWRQPLTLAKAVAQGWSRALPPPAAALAQLHPGPAAALAVTYRPCPTLNRGLKEGPLCRSRPGW